MDALGEALVDKLKAKHLRLATAESCTAGRLAAAFAKIKGSGETFTGGFVTYQKVAKTRILGVSENSLAGPNGAVTGQIAEEMALGARKASGADIAVSTTGVAGPTEDEDGNPVGLVFIAIAQADEVKSQEFRFTGDPDAICARTIDAAMIMLARAVAD